jgi:anthranilate phosphoribosyltransferase
VADPANLPKLAGALALLGTRHALLVCSTDGLDELSVSAPTRVIEVQDGALHEYLVEPQDVGLSVHPPEAIPGGDPERNAEITRAIFAGEAGAARDMAVLNAGAAIYAAGRGESLPEGVALAQEAIDSGAAEQTLTAFVAGTQELARSSSTSVTS